MTGWSSEIRIEGENGVCGLGRTLYTKRWLLEIS